MKYRKLGSSGISVSELGYGTWGIGGSSEGIPSYGFTDDNESQKALEKAFDRGINFFDTATAYGRAEEILGKTFGGSKREKIVIATKVGISKFFTPQDFSERAMTDSLTKSLRNLRTDYVDVLQLFNPPITTTTLDDILGTMIKFKEKGLVRAVGASIKSPAEGLVALTYKEIVCLQVNLNMIDQRAIDSGLLEAASELDVGIIARTPLCFGFLTGKIKDLNFGPDDHRSKWPRAQLELWLKASQLLLDVLPDQMWNLNHMALRFCIDSPGVSTVIAGPISMAEVIDNLWATRLPPLSPEAIEKIRNIYSDNYGFVAPK